MIEEVKRWATFKLVQIAAKLHYGMFMHLCEAAVLAKYRADVVTAEEALRDAIRLEQEHDYDYNHENEEQEHDTIH